ncbi:hypothetical protein RF11_08291 [Thelohanellus kitauei]|uniref:Uncharacterized protein n=1 Tax=Thelohanellus kitauei TaxID=669202 RepID=A0A0C2ML33_THEKT|nr:hypothetical protein RF11_08291 [Thelohanellus kitauei]
MLKIIGEMVSEIEECFNNDKRDICSSSTSYSEINQCLLFSRHHFDQINEEYFDEILAEFYFKRNITLTYHDPTVNEIRHQLRPMDSYFGDYYSNIIKFLVKLNNEFNLTDVDYFIALCYYKRIQSIISSIKKSAYGMMLHKIALYLRLESFNTHRSYLGTPQFKSLKDGAYTNKIHFDGNVTEYLTYIKVGRFLDCHDLIEASLKIIFSDNDISEMIISYTKDMIKKTENHAGKQYLIFQNFIKFE